MTIRRGLSFGLLVAALASCSDPGPGVDPAAKMALCESLSRDYDAAVLAARECTVGSAGACGKMIPATASCLCPVHVDGDIVPAGLIAAHFQAEECFVPSQCPVVCTIAMPGTGTCGRDLSSSTAGRCL